MDRTLLGHSADPVACLPGARTEKDPSENISGNIVFLVDLLTENISKPQLEKEMLPFFGGVGKQLEL